MGRQIKTWLETRCPNCGGFVPELRIGNEPKEYTCRNCEYRSDPVQKEAED